MKTNCKLDRIFENCIMWQENDNGCTFCEHYRFNPENKKLKNRVKELEQTVSDLSELIIKQTEINRTVSKILKDYL